MSEDSKTENPQTEEAVVEETENDSSAGAEASTAAEENLETEMEADATHEATQPQASTADQVDANEEPQSEESQADASPDAQGESTAAEEKAGAAAEAAEVASDAKPAKKKPQKKAKQEDTRPLPPAIEALNQARKGRTPVTGKIIGWNQGGFHVVVGETPAFCPRSAIGLGAPEEPASYVDQEMEFIVLEIRDRGRRVVVSRAAAIKAQDYQRRSEAMSKVEVGAVLTGTVASLTDFGAFIDLGGVQGLLHISEIARSRIDHPSEALSEGDSVEVKVLKVEKGGKRISLSRKALEPDPWKGIGDFKEGQVVDGKVDRAERFGVLVELAPGLSGLIPSSALTLPSDASPQRVFPKGKEMKVQIVSIDRKRKRISLLPEGAQVDGSAADLKAYRERHGEQKLGAMAAAFEKARAK